ncbi:MAG: DUF3857 domain-containing protein [Myxococcota bacterium]
MSRTIFGMMARVRLIPLLLAPLVACHTPQSVVWPGQRLAVPGLSPGDGRDSGVDVLREVGRFEISEDGTKTYTYDLSYDMTGPNGLAAWSKVEARWDPALQARPKILIETILPDGQLVRLDPSSVVESAGENGLRRLTADVPSLRLGARVRRRVVYRDLHPPRHGIVSGQYTMGLSVPTRMSSLEIVSPAAMPIRVLPIGLKPKVTESEVDGHRQVVLTVENLEGLVASQPALPPGVPAQRQVFFSSADSWEQLALLLRQTSLRWKDSPEVQRIGERLQASPSQSVVASALQEVSRTIRLERSTSLPRNPEIVLSTGVGSSVERGLLLASILDARRIETFLVVTSEHLRPEFPGVSGLSRALVYLPGLDVFVDPDYPEFAVGTLGTEVQGRLAMRIADGAFVEVPTLDARANHYSELRSIDLMSGAEAEFVEVTQAGGTIEGRLRRRFSNASDDRELEAQLAAYVRRSYRGARLHQYDIDLRPNQQFSLRLHGRGGAFVRTEEAVTTVFLPAPIIFTWLPEVVRDAVLAAKDATEEQRVAESLLVGRDVDFGVDEPYSASVRFFIRLPENVKLAQEPRSFTSALGPGLYRQSFEKMEDGWAFDVGFVLDRRRMTADETRSLVGGLRQLWSLPVPRVVFRDVASEAISAGRLSEGFRALAAGAEEQPSAGSFLRLARSLQQNRLGFAAHRWARQAASLRPDDPATHLEAADILTHGNLGRRLGSGFARNEAMELIRKARRRRSRWPALDLKLAELLSVRADGTPNSDLEALEEAISLARSAVLAGEVEDGGKLLGELLFRVGRIQDFLFEVESLPRGFELDAHRIAATAYVHGSDAAFAAVTELSLPNDVQNLAVQRAARALVQHQAYDRAAQLLEALQEERSEPSLKKRIALYRSVAEGMDRAVDGPAEPIFELQHLLATDPLPLDRLQSIFTDRAWAFLRPEHGISQFSSAVRRAQAHAKDAGLPPRWPTDVVKSRMAFVWEGNDREGFRVESAIGEPGIGPTGVWFVVKSGAYRIQAAESNPSLLGNQALDWLEQGRAKAAERWLDWAADLVPHDEAPFKTLMSAPDASPRQRRRWAAAALSPTELRSIRILEEAEPHAGDARSEVIRALMEGYALRGESEQQIEAAKRLLALEPASVEGHRAVFYGLWALGRFGEARAWARARADFQPFDSVATDELAQLAFHQGDYAESDRLYRDLIGRGFHSAETLNNLAWLRLMRGSSSDEDLDLARRAVDLSRRGSLAALHTLAGHLVERDRITEALDIVEERKMRQNGLEPDDWYIIGRALESLGLPEDARSAYAHARFEPEEAMRGDSTAILVKRRLAGLEGGTTEAKR